MFFCLVKVNPRQFEKILKFLKNFSYKKKFQTIKMFDKNCLNFSNDVLEYFDAILEQFNETIYFLETL